MKKYLLDYLDYIQKASAECNDSLQLDELIANHLKQIEFMQHERLIHLIVTCLFSIIFFIVLLGFICYKAVVFIPLLLLIICLLVPYIMHYYFLENNVQKMYGIYNSLRQKSIDMRNLKNE